MTAIGSAPGAQGSSPQGASVPGGRSGLTGPGRDGVLNVVVLAVLTALGLFGFGSAYGGSRYFLAGMVGLVLGAVVGVWGARRHQPLIVVVAVATVAFFLFGGVVTMPSKAMAGVLPGPEVVSGLLDGAVRGWAKLLTLNPPVGEVGNLLVVPYLCGLVAGATGVSLVLRRRKPVAVVMIPFLVLILSILFGTMTPASLVLQGTVFGIVAIWWMSSLQAGRTRVDIGTRRTRKWVGSLVMVVVAGVVSSFMWTLVPGANSHPRFILRNYTEPPFDPKAYPSPLIDYRNYTNGPDEDGWQPAPEEIAAGMAGADTTDGVGTTADESTEGWRSTILFEVTGLPSDQRLRLSTMDTYDGIVYSVGDGRDGSGFFQHVSGELPTPDWTPRIVGQTYDATITVAEVDDGRAYQDIWLPVPENTTRIEFLDGRTVADSKSIGESLLWNTATGTAVVPARLRAGDSYRVGASLSAIPDPKDFEDAKAADVVVHVEEVGGISSSARELSEGWGCDAAAVAERMGDRAETQLAVSSVYDKVLLMAQGLRMCGGLSDGAASRNGIPAYPGHGERRLTDMVGEDSAGMLGNGEQFAPLAALLSHAIGVPSRVVMGFRSQNESDDWREAHGLDPNDGTYRIRGGDIAAWIEVAMDRGDGPEWVPVLDVTPTFPEPQLRPPPADLEPQSDPPPPPPSIPPMEEPDDRDSCRAGADPNGDGVVAGDEIGTGCGSEDEVVEDDGFVIPIWVKRAATGVAVPVLLLMVFTGAVAGLKSRRRERRRTAADPATRISGGWHEIGDLATDLGTPVPMRATRREAGAFLGEAAAEKLAHRADAIIFGPADVTDADAVTYWDQVDSVRSTMVSDLSRFGRWRVLVSLSSLRKSGQRRLEAVKKRGS